MVGAVMEDTQKVPVEVKRRVQRSLALRWFKYIQHCKDPEKKLQLIRQYNQIATGRYRDV